MIVNVPGNSTLSSGLSVDPEAKVESRDQLGPEALLKAARIGADAVLLAVIDEALSLLQRADELVTAAHKSGLTDGMLLVASESVDYAIRSVLLAKEAIGDRKP